MVLWVRVADWATERRIVVDGRNVAFEVAGKCRPSCGSCNARMALVDRRMREAGNGFKHRWTSRDLREECYLVLEDASWKPDEAVARLSDLLALPIRVTS
jgi:hypothetical protein